MRGTALCAAQKPVFPAGRGLSLCAVGDFAVEFYFYSLIQSESLHPLGTDFPRPGEAFSRKAYFYGFLRVSVYASGK